MNEAIERIYKLTVQADQAVAEMKKAGNAAENIQKQFASAGKVLAGIFAGVSVAAVVQGFKSITEEADKIGKASQKFGVGVEALQTLGYAAGQSGVDFDTMARALQNLNKQLVDVDKGTDAASKALRALGVSGADSPEEAFRKIAEGLSSIPAGAQKTASALAIFGKAGADLIPLLDEGAGGIAKLEQRAHELGVVMNGEAIEAATAFNDSLDDMETAVRGIWRNIVTGMLPAVSDLATELAGSAKASEDWKRTGANLAEVLKTLALFAYGVGTGFARIGEGLGATAAQIAIFNEKGFKGFKEIAGVQKDFEENAKASNAEFLKTVEIIKNLGTAQSKANDAAKDTTGTDARKKAVQDLQKALADALKTQDKVDKVKPAKAEKVDKTPMERFVENAIKAQEEADLLIPKLDQLQALFFQGKIDSDTFERLKESLGVLGPAIDDAIDPIEAYANAVKQAQIESDLWADKAAKLEELHASGAISAATLAEEYKKLGVGYKELTDKEALAGVKEMNQAIANGLQQGVSGLVDMIFEANQSWTEFAANFLKSIAKMLVEFAILKALKSSSTFGSFFASAHGNAFSGATGLPQGVYPAGHPMYFPMGPGNGPLTRFAHGGTIGVLAEGNNAEAIVPLMRHGGDLGVKASPVNIVVNNTMADSANVEVAETNKPDGSKQISLTIRKEIRAAMSDGSMDATMRGNFGLSRKAVR